MIYELSMGVVMDQSPDNLILRKMCKLSGGALTFEMNIEEIGKDLGLTGEQIENAAESLLEDGLIDTDTLGYDDVRLTNKGINRCKSVLL